MDQRLDSFVRDCHAKADAGVPESQYDLAILFSTGKGVPLDYVTAHKWFNLAAAGGVTEARAFRADLAAQMPREDVALVLRLAREWLAGRVPAPAPELPELPAIPVAALAPEPHTVTA